jgi:AN1-type zinc finger protein 5/6
MKRNLKMSGKLCKNNCGFFASKDGLCSECFKKNTLENKQEIPKEETTNIELKIKCEICKKKLGLTGIQCKCGKHFCSLHRYPEEHNCDFDYKSFTQNTLRKVNKQVICSKIDSF